MQDAGKRAFGQYYTRRNPFDHPAFRSWAEEAEIAHLGFLEPFAGAGYLLDMVKNLGLATRATGYDIAPAAPWVEYRDTLADFPRGHRAVITNPPYLARNSARRRGLDFPETPHGDLYIHAIDTCLAHTPFVAAIIPESFLSARYDKDRMRDLISLPYSDMFDDTDHPTCLALFGPEKDSRGPRIWCGRENLGSWTELLAHVSAPKRHLPIRFNDPEGEIGLYGVDGTQGPSIRFVPGEEIDPSLIKHSSRSVSRISAGLGFGTARDAVLDRANAALAEMREKTHDVGMTAFKGIRKDGKFRRRIDFKDARALLEQAIDAGAQAA